MARLRPVLLTLTLALSAFLGAEEHAHLRTISTEGESIVKVVPDEVSINLEVSNLSPEIVAGRKLHSQRVQAVIEAAKAAGVEAKDVQTDFLQIQPEYEHSNKLLSGPEKKLLGYRFRTSIAVLLRDISKFESLLEAALTSGAETVHSIQFRTSQLRKHRDAARAAALRAAREKAIAMAAELGQKVGSPRLIQEGQNWSGTTSRGFGSMTQNSWSAAPGGGASEGGLAPGMINVQANVSVTFDLE